MSDDGLPSSELILYQTEDGLTRLQVRLQDETVWLTQKLMAELFETSVPNVSMHIRNVFLEGELQEGSVVQEFLTTAADGKNYSTRHYNLDVIISVGYRVKSLRGTQFRIWATQRLREYIVKGFTMDDERLKRVGGGAYFDELLKRIRDIRSSERPFYQKVLDIDAGRAAGARNCCKVCDSSIRGRKAGFPRSARTACAHRQQTCRAIGRTRPKVDSVVQEFLTAATDDKLLCRAIHKEFLSVQ